MVGAAVVIDEERHVPGHLPLRGIASHEVQRIGVFGQAAAVEAHPRGAALAEMLRQGVDRINPGVGASGPQEGVGACGAVADRHAAQGARVPGPFGFEVEPHDVFARAGVADHLRAFEDAAFFDRAARAFGSHGQGDAFVAPVVEVLRGVAVYADLREVARLACGLVLAEPVVAAFVVEDAASVGVDDGAAGVGPDRSGPELRAGAARGRKNQPQGCEQGGSAHGCRYCL